MRWIMAGCGVLLLSGCSAGDRRCAVSGTVLFQGKPLDQGVIEFVAANIPGPVSGGMIAGGSFDIPQEQGLEPGTYQVRIQSFEPVLFGSGPGKGSDTPGLPPGVGPGRSPRNCKQRIGAQFNSKTTLTITVQERGLNHFEFVVD